MKELMVRITNFVTFESPLQTNFISFKFKSIHTSQQERFDSWGTDATRYKLLYNYWFNSVAKHFSFLLAASGLFTFINLQKVDVLAVLSFGTLSFLIVYFFNYKPLYFSIFLPHVEMIKEEYEQELKGKITKCRKAQYSNFALVLIHTVMAEISNMNPLMCDDKSALMLTELYGVDTGSMKKNLEILFIKNKRKHFTERQKTEYKNRFNEAYDFFEKCECVNGVKKLKEYENNFYN